MILADREQVEQGSDDLFAGAGTSDVALLVVGDPLGATTHTDLKLRAYQLGIPVEVREYQLVSVVGRKRIL